MGAKGRRASRTIGTSCWSVAVVGALALTQATAGAGAQTCASAAQSEWASVFYDAAHTTASQVSGSGWPDSLSEFPIPPDIATNLVAVGGSSGPLLVFGNRTTVSAVDGFGTLRWGVQVVEEPSGLFIDGAIAVVDIDARSGREVVLQVSDPSGVVSGRIVVLDLESGEVVRTISTVPGAIFFAETVREGNGSVIGVLAVIDDLLTLYSYPAGQLRVLNQTSYHFARGALLVADGLGSAAIVATQDGSIQRFALDGDLQWAVSFGRTYRPGSFSFHFSQAPSLLMTPTWGPVVVEPYVEPRLSGPTWGGVLLVDPISARVWADLQFGEEVSGVATGDVDGDGWADLVVSANRTFAYSVAQNRTLWVHASGGAAQLTASLADLNSDGRLDVILAAWAGHLFVIDGQDGEAVFERAIPPTWYPPSVSDLDRDGVIEIYLPTLARGTFLVRAPRGSSCGDSPVLPPDLGGSVEPLSVLEAGLGAAVLLLVVAPLVLLTVSVRRGRVRQESLNAKGRRAEQESALARNRGGR